MNIKVHFFAALLISFITLPAQGAQSSIEGHWQGAFVRDGAVQVIRVDFFKDAGVLKAQMQTPDLVISEPPPVSAMLNDSKLQLETPFGKATLSIDFPMGEMIGTVGDTNPPIQVHLKRTFKPLEIPIKMEELQFRNGDVTLAATLVTPAPQARTLRWCGFTEGESLTGAASEDSLAYWPNAGSQV